MGLDNAVLGYIEEKVDQLMNLQMDFDEESSPSKKTDMRIVIDRTFDGMIVNLKYWGDDEKQETPRQKEDRQKALAEFGFPEKL